MTEKPLTQEAIDSGPEIEAQSGLFAKAAQHPILAGGAVLIGAGLAYAAARMIQGANDNSEAAKDVHIETSIAINKPAAELYAFWRDFKNLPQFMKNLESVTDVGNGKTHWIAKGIGDTKFEWDAEIFNEVENELVAWRSLENADVTNAGSVRFQPGPEGHGTYVRVTMNYNPPAGKVGATLAKLLGTEPSQLIKEDLRRFKQLMEAGEIATIDGQSSGRVLDEAKALSASAISTNAV